MSATIQNELEKTYGSENVTVEKDGDTYTVAITGKGTYKIEANGKVEKQGPAVTYSNERIVESSDGTGTTVAAGTKTPNTDKLYIYFEASVEGGTTSISPSVPFEIIENGTYSFTITSTVNGENFTTTKTYTADQYDLRAGIDVGDYVNYTPKVASTTYSKDYLGEKYTGSTSNTSDLTQETLKWRVLTKYSDGRLDLIASEPTEAMLSFKSATGYNNGVYILHDICEKLYSNTDHNITARSVSLEDFEKNMTEAGKTARNSYDNSGNSPQYGHTNYEKWGSAYINKNYPNIYASENGSGINIANGLVKTDGIEDTEKRNLDITSGSSAYKTATELTARQTLYVLTINNINYGEVSEVLVISRQVRPWSWVASRFVRCDSGDVFFGLRTASTYLNGIYLFNSYPDEGGLGIRPIVQLGSDVDITPSATASSETGIPHTINW